MLLLCNSETGNNARCNEYNSGWILFFLKKEQKYVSFKKKQINTWVAFFNKMGFSQPLLSFNPFS